MSEKANLYWARAILVCALGGGAFSAGLILNQTTAGRAIASGILLGIVALIPAGLLLLFERINYRFSLRALLIATTLVSVGIVVAVCVLRK